MKMNGDLELYVPRREDGLFYVKMMSDPETMSYNAPWFPPYGCIPDPEGEWAYLNENWFGREPERFYAYLRKRSDGSFVGDVNYHHDPDEDRYEMGIVIHAPERGKGYGRQGLKLLLDKAFRVDGIAALHNEFETTRGAARAIHESVGFRETQTADGTIRMEITREDYLAMQKDEKGTAEGRQDDAI